MLLFLFCLLKYLVELAHGRLNKHLEFFRSHRDALLTEDSRDMLNSLLEFLFTVKVFVKLLNSLYTVLDHGLYRVVVDVLGVELLG